MSAPGPITAVLVDDEPLPRERIRGLLAAVPQVQVVGEAAGGQEAVRLIEATAPDLVFLDIQMPDLDGFGVLEALDTTRPPAVVFVTAHDAYAIRAFDHHALDYLLKPLEPQRFARTVERAIAALDRLGGDRVETLLADVGRDDATPLRIAVRSEGRITLLDPDQIDWLEADGKHVRLHVGTAVLPARRTLTYLAERLRHRGFIRIHRSTVVNAARIRAVEPWFHGEFVVILHSGAKLRSSAAHSAELHALLDKAL